jgi:hypothetical protein
MHCVFYRFEHRFQKLQLKAPDSTPKHFIKKDIIPNSKGDDGIVYSKKQKNIMKTILFYYSLQFSASFLRQIHK